eukprot:4531018-Pleurochrysis_carterae.AAC.1
MHSCGGNDHARVYAYLEVFNQLSARGGQSGHAAPARRVGAVLVYDVRLRLALVRGRSDGGVDVVLGVTVDDDPVLAKLLLDQNHLRLVQFARPPEHTSGKGGERLARHDASF